jgi:hypothetical protein
MRQGAGRQRSCPSGHPARGSGQRVAPEGHGTSLTRLRTTPDRFLGSDPRLRTTPDGPSGKRSELSFIHRRTRGAGAGKMAARSGSCFTGPRGEARRAAGWLEARQRRGKARARTASLTAAGAGQAWLHRQRRRRQHPHRPGRAGGRRTHRPAAAARDTRVRHRQAPQGARVVVRDRVPAGRHRPRLRAGLSRQHRPARAHGQAVPDPAR